MNYARNVGPLRAIDEYQFSLLYELRRLSRICNSVFRVSNLYFYISVHWKLSTRQAPGPRTSLRQKYVCLC